jgi:hypothetical protein
MVILCKFTAEGEQKYEVRLHQIQQTKQDVILRNGGESFNDNNETEMRPLLTLAPRAGNGEILPANSATEQNHCFMHEI